MFVMRVASTRAEFKNEWRYTSIPSYAFMTCIGWHYRLCYILLGRGGDSPRLCMHNLLSPLNNPEDRRIQFNRGGSLQSRIPCHFARAVLPPGLKSLSSSSMVFEHGSAYSVCNDQFYTVRVWDYENNKHGYSTFSILVIRAPETVLRFSVSWNRYLETLLSHLWTPMATPLGS